MVFPSSWLIMQHLKDPYEKVALDATNIFQHHFKTPIGYLQTTTPNMSGISDPFSS